MNTPTIVRLGCSIWLCTALTSACDNATSAPEETDTSAAGASAAPSSKSETAQSEQEAQKSEPSTDDAAPSSASRADTATQTQPSQGSMAPEMATEPMAAASGASATTAQADEPIDWNADIRGRCNLTTEYPDDQACIPAPPPEMGMQIHIGPEDYNDPEDVARFIMHPGEESSECFVITTPNDKDVHYQTHVLSGRAGTHHIITTLYDDKLEEGGFKSCASDFGMEDGPKRLGDAPGASKPYMPRGTVAPEYAHVGKVIPAHARWQSDMHYYNFTDHDIVREFWVNIYYADNITEIADQIVGFGGLSWNSEPIAPGTDQTYSYSCPIVGEGNILSLLGHYHAHGTKFTASIQRAAGGIDKVFEMYSYLDPATFEYNSVVQNPEFSAMAAGAVSGQLMVHDGDALLWDCHIINDLDVGLTYTNEVKTGEMCNVWGSSIGVEPIRCFLQ